MSTTADLVTMAGGDGARVYAIGKVPASPTYPYRVLGFVPQAPVVRNSLGGGDPVRRFYVQHFSKTADGLEAITEQTFAAFDGKAFGGDVITQETASAIDRDADDRGVYSSTHTYRY
jgi:hypothetical protein